MQINSQKSEPMSPFDALPDEVLTDILDKVAAGDVRQLLSAQRVCQRWHGVSFSVPNIVWPLDSTVSGAALINFLMSRRQSGAKIGTINLTVSTNGLLTIPRI
jgi:hypothetical protein